MPRFFPFILCVPLALACSGRSRQSAAPAAGPPSTAPAAVTVAASVDRPAAAEPAAVCPKRPNVLVISLDTLRFDATSLDPASPDFTPNLRRLAREGINFLNCYSTHDSTPPSHFSLMTGYVNGYQTEIDRPEASLAFQLGKLGYRSFGVAANVNLSTASTIWTLPFTHYENLGDEWNHFSESEKAARAPELDARLIRYGGQPNDWYRMMLYGSTEAMVTRLQRQIAHTRLPFLGFINLLDAHDPYVPPAGVYSASDEQRLHAPRVRLLRYRPLPDELAHPEQIADPERRAFVQAKLAQAQGRAWSVALDLDPQARRVYRARYQGEVRVLDQRVGEIMDTLQAKGLRDSTIVVITADHGESFGEEELMTHSFDDRGDRESTHHVPMLVLLPRCYHTGGVTVTQTVTIADVAPTIYALVGIDARPLWRRSDPKNHGRSILPLLPRAITAGDGSVAEVKENETISPAQRRQMNDEALKRFRSLGYIQ